MWWIARQTRAILGKQYTRSYKIAVVILSVVVWWLGSCNWHWVIAELNLGRYMPSRSCYLWSYGISLVKCVFCYMAFYALTYLSTLAVNIIHYCISNGGQSINVCMIWTSQAEWVPPTWLGNHACIDDCSGGSRGQSFEIERVFNQRSDVYLCGRWHHLHGTTNRRPRTYEFWKSPLISDVTCGLLSLMLKTRRYPWEVLGEGDRYTANARDKPGRIKFSKCISLW